MQTADSTITIPIPNYEELQIGTLRSIIRQSGLARALFEVN
jgi:predicted RNA binding protein YcfA (HicA-like mRNA interferase family)